MVGRLRRSAWTVRQTLLDLLFPPRCVICRRAEAAWFCSACRTPIERIPPPLCDRCGRPLRAKECFSCSKLPLRIDGIRAMAFFEGNLRKAIHAFKYEHHPELAGIFASLLSGYLGVYPLPADAVAAVPLHPSREHTRGYDQALLLARELGAQTNLPVIEYTLKRVRATRSQTELGAAMRQANVKDAFVADGRVAGKRLLLIDDVCTTGATMDECGVALKRRGALSVWGLALARGR